MTPQQREARRKVLRDWSKANPEKRKAQRQREAAKKRATNVPADSTVATRAPVGERVEFFAAEVPVSAFRVPPEPQSLSTKVLL